MSGVSAPLTLNPYQPPSRDIVRALTVRVERPAAGVLQFEYRLEGDVARLRVPEKRAPRQVDELWKHTCFEAFIAVADDPSALSPATTPQSIGAYRELNFAPSTEWAAYSFTGYRAGMAPVVLPPPDIRVEATSSSLELIARIDTRALFASTDADLARAPLRIAIATVVEDDAGAITYWALQHAPARPDFHHPAGFILEV